MDYTKLSLLEVSSLLQEGKVTSVELTKQCLNNIEQNKRLNALNSVCSEFALEQAQKVDKMRADGVKLGALAGVPITIKDNINIKGLKTTCSSKFLENFEAPYNATIIEKLLSENVVIVGKNNLDEFAMGSSTENSAFGPALNPHNTNYVSGGSSGGSACAVAANLCFASIGTDTGGSVRQPASLCGVVGLKPTYGLVSRYGIVAFASSLDQAGPLTKTVKDSALMLNAICGYDQREETSNKNQPKIDYLKSFSGSVKGIKIGLVKEFFGEGLNSEVKASILKVAEFYKSKGAEIIEISMPNVGNALACYYVLSSAEAASNLARFDGVKYGVSGSYSNLNELYLKNRSNGFGKEVKRRIMLGNYVLSSGYYDAYYKKAKAVQKLIVNEFAKVFETCDVLLTPTSPTPAFKIGEKVNDTLSMYLSDVYTVPVNIAELPAISVPCGFSSNGLPIGMQLIGKKFSEQTLFNVADVFDSREAK